MMGRQTGDQRQLFYLFNLETRIPSDHLLRRINPTVTGVLADLREKLARFYSEIGRPSVDPELMLRMLIVGYCYGIRSERRLCEEVHLNLAYRWFCRLDLDDKVPHHSTFSENRLHRFRQGDVFRQIFERVVAACNRLGAGEELIAAHGVEAVEDRDELVEPVDERGPRLGLGLGHVPGLEHHEQSAGRIFGGMAPTVYRLCGEFPTQKTAMPEVRLRNGTL